MGPIKRIKRHTAGTRSIKFRQALQSFARDPASVGSPVRAAPDVYAALAERAVYWTGDLLSGLLQAAEQRESLRPTAANVLGLVAGYFEQSERWPPEGSSLDAPARLCIPSCFALHVAEEFNSAVWPPLVRFGSENVHKFYRELLGSTVMESVAAAAKSAIVPLLPMARSTGGASRDTPPVDLTEPPVFDAELRRRWRRAREQAAAPTSAPRPPTTASPEVALRSAWQSRLENARLRAGGDVLRDSDYSGGGYCTWRERTIVLEKGGNFFWHETSRMRVTAAGLTNTTEMHDDRRGTWKLSLLKKGPVLELHGADGRIGLFWLSDGDRGRILLDGKPYSVTR